jgi:hypothetical protein
MAVMIGVDPHKASHTAVAIDQAEQLLGMPAGMSTDPVTRQGSGAPPSNQKPACSE